MRIAFVFCLSLILFYPFIEMTASAQTQSTTPKPPDTIYLLKPAHVFDGESAQLRDGWVVLVHGEKIEAVGPASEVKAPADAKVIDLPGMTLMPGLIEAHPLNTRRQTPAGGVASELAETRRPFNAKIATILQTHRRRTLRSR